MEPITAALIATVAGLAQRGLNLLANALLSKGKAVVEDRLGVSIDDMLATPEGVEELRKLELKNFRTLTEFTTTLNQHTVELERARLTDIASARAMQIEAMRQDDPFTKRFPYYFAAFWSFWTMVYFFCVTFAPIPAAGVRFADTILGFMLGTAVASIFAYLYGTNRVSALKDTTISALATKSP